MLLPLGGIKMFKKLILISSLIPAVALADDAAIGGCTQYPGGSSCENTAIGSLDASGKSNIFRTTVKGDLNLHGKNDISESTIEGKVQAIGANNIQNATFYTDVNMKGHVSAAKSTFQGNVEIFGVLESSQSTFQKTTTISGKLTASETTFDIINLKGNEVDLSKHAHVNTLTVTADIGKEAVVCISDGVSIDTINFEQQPGTVYNDSSTVGTVNNGTVVRDDCPL